MRIVRTKTERPIINDVDIDLFVSIIACVHFGQLVLRRNRKKQHFQQNDLDISIGSFGSPQKENKMHLSTRTQFVLFSNLSSDALFALYFISFSPSKSERCWAASMCPMLVAC